MALALRTPAPDVLEHATRERYQAGCRCLDCKRANAAYEHRRRRARVVVDACGCTG